MSAVQQVVKDLESDGLDAITEGEFTALVVLSKSNPILLETDGGHCEVRKTLWAGGSGSAAALAGLHTGLNATDSVLLATKVDLYTGGPVHTYDIKRRRWLKPKK